MNDETLDRLIAAVGHYGETNEAIFQMSLQLAEAKRELTRLRAVLATAHAAAEAYNWTACRDALQGAVGGEGK